MHNKTIKYVQQFDYKVVSKATVFWRKIYLFLTHKSCVINMIVKEFSYTIIVSINKLVSKY